jgi:hypothetical protein
VVDSQQHQHRVDSLAQHLPVALQQHRKAASVVALQQHRKAASVVASQQHRKAASVVASHQQLLVASLPHHKEDSVVASHPPLVASVKHHREVSNNTQVKQNAPLPPPVVSRPLVQHHLVALYLPRQYQLPLPVVSHPLVQHHLVALYLPCQHRLQASHPLAQYPHVAPPHHSEQRPLRHHSVVPLPRQKVLRVASLISLLLKLVCLQPVKQLKRPRHILLVSPTFQWRLS